MDPYLEGSEWRSVHTHFGVEIARYLAPRIQPKYIVRAEKNYILTTTDAGEDDAAPISRRSPDVSILRSHGSELLAAEGNVAVAEPPLRLAVVMPEEVPQITVEIHYVAERRLVTAIEILSDTNKRGDGREEYLTKRRRLLRSHAHLLEIDLLRRGSRPPMAKPLPPAEYFVILSRAESRPIADVWPVSLRSSLPAVPVPLLKGDPDVSLSLQEVLTSTYDSFRYDLELNYDRPPEVALTAANAAWAQELLKTWKAEKKTKS